MPVCQSGGGGLADCVGVLEEYFGVDCYRITGVLCTCGLVALTGGVFDLLWCCLLARQRQQVRDMYHIDGSPCCDCFLACCCRCCMFNQLKHQLEVDNPNPPDPAKPQQVNSMQQPKVELLLPQFVPRQSRSLKKVNPGQREYL